MAATDEAWAAWISGAVCAASRWVSATSIVLALGALALLAARPQPGAASAAALALVVLLGAAQVYLAVRIEFDRAIFARAVERPGGFSGFDEVLRQLGWRRGPAASRTPEARAAGLRALIMASACLLGAQFALALAALGLAR